MDQNRLTELFERYMNAVSTPAETQELLEYIAASKNPQLVMQQLENALNTEQGLTALAHERQTEILERIFETHEISNPNPKVRSLTWLKAAAVITFFLSAGSFFIWHTTHKSPTLAANMTNLNNIHPGGNKAILTLANGTKIDLNDQLNGTIIQQGGAQVIKLGNGQLAYDVKSSTALSPVYNTMTTPRGGKYDLILADGTKVWLNAASSITYPTVFTGNERTVIITGEAYFEVAHNKDKPFRVSANGQIVEVLGTHFNVNAYADESATTTTLLEGRVKIYKGLATAILNPGQQSVIEAHRDLIAVRDADTDEAIAWKNGLTSFKNADIKTIMRQISRWYSIDISYKGEISEQRLFTGEISRKADLQQVLKVLELSDIHFTVNGGRLLVSP